MEPSLTWYPEPVYRRRCLPYRAWRIAAHGVLGWILFPLRYLDLLLLRSPQAARLGNHCYLWLRKPPLEVHPVK